MPALDERLSREVLNGGVVSANFDFFRLGMDGPIDYQNLVDHFDTTTHYALSLEAHGLMDSRL